MSEQKMIDVVGAALARQGIEDKVLAVGQFYPRGHTGGAFAGSMVGGGLGDAFGSFAGSVGSAGGYVAGAHAADDASGLPGMMLVAVTQEAVYGFAGRSRSRNPPTSSSRCAGTGCPPRFISGSTCGCWSSSMTAAARPSSWRETVCR
jgi:hypothetical protein